MATDLGLDPGLAPPVASPTAPAPDLGGTGSSAAPDQGTSGQTAFMIDPSGATVQLPMSEMRAALQQGYTQASPKQVQDALRIQQFHKEYGGTNGAITAAGLSLARGATLGLSDVVGSAIDPDWAERSAAYAKENPTASVLGGVASLAASGPLTKLGGAVTEGLQRGLPAATSTVGKIVRQAVATGGGSAVMSAAYGAGNVVSEAALGDPALNGQAALATAIDRIGMAGIFGGALGAGGSLAWNLGKELVPAGLKAKIINGLDQTAGINTLKQAGADRKDLKTLLNIKGADEAAAIGNEMREMGLADDLATSDTIGKRALAKMQEVGPKLEKLYNNPDVTDLPSAQSVIMKIRNRIAGPILDNPAARMSGVAQKLNGELDLWAQKYADGWTLNDMWQMRQGFDNAINWAKNEMGGAAIPSLNGAKMQARILINDEIRNTIQKNLGASAVKDWETLNRAYYISDLASTFAGHGSVADAASPLLNWTSKLAGAAGGVEGALHAAVSGHNPLTMGGLTGAAVALGAQALHEHGPALLAAGSAAAKRALESGITGMVPEIAGPLMSAAMSKVSANEAEAYLKHAGQDDALASLVNETGNRIATERRVTNMDPNMPGPVGDSAIPLLHSPEKVALLAEIERQRKTVLSDIEDAARGLTRDSVRDQTVHRNEVAPGLDKSFGSSADQQIKVFQQRVQMLNRVMSDPEEMERILTQQTDYWHDHAPAVATEINAATVRAINYLAGQMPHRDPSGPLMQQVTPTIDQVARFNRSWEAVEHPLRLLQQAKTGVLTKEAVDAASMVYPQLMDEFKKAAIDSAVSRGDGAHIPYQKRLQIGKLLGEDVDGTMGAISNHQQVYSQRRAQGPQGGRGGRGGGGRPMLSIGQRSRTDTQRSTEDDKE